MNSDNFKEEITRYFIGGGIALVITVFAFIVVSAGFNVAMITRSLLFLAVLQTIVQLFYFLHLNKESKPRWHSHTFIFTAIMLLIVVIGSLWIMRNLDYRMNMAPEQMQEFMLEQNKKGF